MSKVNISVMKQQQQSKDELQADKGETNTNLRAKRELRKSHHLEEFVTSFGIYFVIVIASA